MRQIRQRRLEAFWGCNVSPRPTRLSGKAGDRLASLAGRWLDEAYHIWRQRILSDTRSVGGKDALLQFHTRVLVASWETWLAATRRAVKKRHVSTSCGSVAATRNKRTFWVWRHLTAGTGTTTGRSRGAASYSRRLAWHGMGEVEGHGLATKGRCVQAGRGSHEHETPLSHQSLHGMEKRRRRCPMEGEHCLRDACEMGREGHFASMEDMASHGAAWSLDGPCS